MMGLMAEPLLAERVEPSLLRVSFRIATKPIRPRRTFF
jgi:hypothetical protein